MTTAPIVVQIAAAAWRRAVPAPAAKVRRWAAAARAAAGTAPGGEITIVLADDPLVRELNHTYRGQNKPTNVLSFPAGASPAASAEHPLGDVVIALGTTRREAAAARRPLADHLAHLVVHGVLHLLGHDHVRPAPARRMERLEAGILAGFGIPDPYAPAPARRRA